MKYCNNCNNGIDDSAEVCPICGEKQAVDAVPVQSMPDEKKMVGASVAGFVIGILSLVLCNTVIGPLVGLVLGILGTRKFDESRNKSRWVGVAAIALNALAIVLAVIAVVTIFSMYFSGQLEPDAVN